MRACTLPFPAACLALAAALPAAVHAQVPTTAPGPERRADHLEVIPILGDETTAQPSPAIANLDAGDLVAGRTWWEFDRDVIWVETFLGCPPGLRSYVTAGSSDGGVLVGDVGTSADDVQATRWIDGVEAPLAAVPGATTSSALFTSDDGGTVIGTATVGGERLLARWTPDGAVATYAPPPGLGVEEVNATNPDASVVVGALSDDPAAFQSNWVPFRWRPSDGFTLIDELGLPDEYDLSEATDVSDDGTRVIGDLGHWVFGPGSTPPAAFLWTEADGTRDLDAVQAELSGEELGFHAALAMSGDGRRILVDGVPAPSPQDSNAVILAFSAAP